MISIGYIIFNQGNNNDEGIRIRCVWHKRTVLRDTKIYTPIVLFQFSPVSSLIKMQRVLAYCIRFSFRARHQPVLTEPFARTELNYFLTTGIKETQRIYYFNLRKQIVTSQMIISLHWLNLLHFIIMTVLFVLEIVFDIRR